MWHYSHIQTGVRMGETDEHSCFKLKGWVKRKMQKKLWITLNEECLLISIFLMGLVGEGDRWPDTTFTRIIRIIVYGLLIVGILNTFFKQKCNIIDLTSLLILSVVGSLSQSLIVNDDLDAFHRYRFYGLMCFCIYILGKNYLATREKKTERLVKLIMVLIIALVINLLLEIWSFVGYDKLARNNSELMSSTEGWTEFWTGYYGDRTSMAALGCIIISLFLVGCLLIWEKSINGAIIIVVNTITLCFYMRRESKTILMVFILSFIISGMLLWIIKNEKEYLLICLVMCGGCLISLFVMIEGVFDGKLLEKTRFFSEESFVGSGKILSNVRWKWLMESLLHLNKFKCGMLDSKLSLPHNVIGAFAYYNGKLAFWLISIFMIISVLKWISFVRKSNVILKYKIALSAIYIAMFLVLMIDPIAVANPYYFIIFCMIVGLFASEEKENFVENFDFKGLAEKKIYFRFLIVSAVIIGISVGIFDGITNQNTLEYVRKDLTIEEQTVAAINSYSYIEYTELEKQLEADLDKREIRKIEARMDELQDGIDFQLSIFPDNLKKYYYYLIEDYENGDAIHCWNTFDIVISVIKWLVFIGVGSIIMGAYVAAQWNGNIRRDLS